MKHLSESYSEGYMGGCTSDPVFFSKAVLSRDFRRICGVRRRVKARQSAKVRQTLLVVLALALTGGVSGNASAYATGPTASLKRSNERIHTLLEKESKGKTSQDAAISKKIRGEVSRFLDFKELARRALAIHWQKRSKRERARFVKVLRQLIERNYVKQLRGNLNYQIRYRSESIDGKTAQVTTAIVMKSKDGEEDEIAVDYKMRKVGKGWMVYDVITDDVSIVRNYRSQFNRIIRRQSYQALVQKMERRLGTI